MPDIHKPDRTARDIAEQIMLARAKNPTSHDVRHHLIEEGVDLQGRDRLEFAADVLNWIASAESSVRFPPICAAEVFYLADNRIFGKDGWTWCRVIGGDPRDNAEDLPHCADQADAVAKATAWLGHQVRVDPAFPAPVVEARIEDSAR